MTTPSQQLLAYLQTTAATALSDAAAATAFNALPPTSKVGPVYCTYLWLGTLAAPFGLNAAAALQNGLQAWINGPDLSASNPALPSPTALSQLNQRLLGYPGIDLTSAATPSLIELFAAGVSAANLAPLLSAAQAAAMLGFGYNVATPAATADVTSARAWMARQALLQSISTAAGNLLNEYLPSLIDPTATAAPTNASIIAQLQSLLTAAGVS